MSAQTKPSRPSRDEYYGRIRKANLAPLWEVLDDLVPASPSSRCVPALWRYEDIRPRILEAGELISAKEAQRRVLILENPACPGEARITNTLFSGLQLLLPGEVAPSHRHSQSALRFIIEGEGSFTSVDGERTMMRPGDMILTPSWTWHDHGNESDQFTIWLDGLDIPLVRFFESGFLEQLGEDSQPLTRSEGDAEARYGSNLLPVDYRVTSASSPVFSYRYEHTREALERLRSSQEMDPCHGVRMKYINPTTGGHALPTIASFIQLIPGGLRTRRYQSTDGAVYVGVEGHGRSRVGKHEFTWGPSDVFVVPSWVPYTHEVDEDAILFSFSDRAIQEQMGLWRERRHDD